MRRVSPCREDVECKRSIASRPESAIPWSRLCTIRCRGDQDAFSNSQSYSSDYTTHTDATRSTTRLNHTQTHCHTARGSVIEESRVGPWRRVVPRRIGEQRAISTLRGHDAGPGHLHRHTHTHASHASHAVTGRTRRNSTAVLSNGVGLEVPWGMGAVTTAAFHNSDMHNRHDQPCGAAEAAVEGNISHIRQTRPTTAATQSINCLRSRREYEW